MPLPVHQISDGVHVLAFHVILQLRAGVFQAFAQPTLFTALAGFFGRLIAWPVVGGVGGAFFGGQSGPADLVWMDHLVQSLPQIGSRGRVPARLAGRVPEMRSIEPAL